MLQLAKTASAGALTIATVTVTAAVSDAC